MRTRIILAAIALLLGLSSQAANFYVRPSYSSGSHTGVDWNNAWNDFSGISWGSVSPGDTVWIAGGTYGSLTFGKDGATNNPITLQRVTASDSVPTSAAGYSTSFNSPAIIPTILSFKNHSFVTLDGGVNDGIQVTSGGGTGSYAIQMNTFGAGGATVYQETIKHLTLYGAQKDGNWDGSSATGGYGIDVASAPGGSASVGFLISHCTINGVCEMITGLDGVKDLTVEYCNLLHCLGNSAAGGDHPDIVYIWNFNGFVMRYNWIYDGSADGIFWGGSGGPTANFKFYGNVCVGGQHGGNGPCLWINPSYGQSGFEIYNNTFVGPWANAVFGGVGTAIHNAGGTLSFPNTNNIFWNCGNEAGGGDYNLYDVSTGASTEAHKIINPANPFISYIVNATNGNFRLTAGSSPVNAGVTLSATYNTDPDGNTRGPGGWDIGAYELGGAPSTNPVILVTPAALSFGYLLTNTASTNTLTVQNVGAGTLIGLTSVLPPYTVLSGATYSLTNGQSQTVTVKFLPTSVGQFSQGEFFSGGGGATAQLSGVGMEAFAVNKIFQATNGYITQPFSLTSTGAVFQVSEIDNPATSGQAQYWVEIPTTGNYEVNGYIQAPNGGANSLYITFDTPNVEPNTIWDVATNSAFAWSLASNRGTGTFDADQFVPMIWNLAAGPHQLLVGGREANTYLGAWQVIAAGSGPPAPNGLRIARVTYP